MNGMKIEKRRILLPMGKMKVILPRPEHQAKPLPGILRIHGGGCITGMAGVPASVDVYHGNPTPSICCCPGSGRAGGQGQGCARNT